MQAKRSGDWKGVKERIDSLRANMERARQLCLQRWALKAEQVSKGHISAQDLPWRALSPRSVAYKAANNYSTNILVMTGSYFQSITSWVDRGTAYAGVARGVRSNTGDDMSVIAKVNEYGSYVQNIPARPLWQPTFDETMRWTVDNNDPGKIFMELVK